MSSQAHRTVGHLAKAVLASGVGLFMFVFSAVLSHTYVVFGRDPDTVDLILGVVLLPALGAACGRLVNKVAGDARSLALPLSRIVVFALILLALWITFEDSSGNVTPSWVRDGGDFRWAVFILLTGMIAALAFWVGGSARRDPSRTGAAT